MLCIVLLFLSSVLNFIINHSSIQSRSSINPVYQHVQKLRVLITMKVARRLLQLQILRCPNASHHLRSSVMRPTRIVSSLVTCTVRTSRCNRDHMLFVTRAVLCCVCHGRSQLHAAPRGQYIRRAVASNSSILTLIIISSSSSSSSSSSLLSSATNTAHHVWCMYVLLLFYQIVLGSLNKVWTRVTARLLCYLLMLMTTTALVSLDTFVEDKKLACCDS